MINFLKELLKQFPFIVPRGFTTAKKIIHKQQRKASFYMKNRQFRHYLLEKKRTYFLPHPKSIQENYLKHFTRNQAYKTKTKSLYFFYDIFIFGNEGLLINNRHYIIEDFTHNFNISSLKKKNNLPFKHFSVSNLKIIGTSASLLSPQSDNIYHWVFDVLARIRLYKNVLNQIDHFLISDTVPKNFTDLLIYFGIEEKKIIRVKKNAKIKVEYLYVSDLVGSEGRSHENDVDYLIDCFKPNYATRPTKRLYIKRGNVKSRCIENEEEIVELLAKEGFTSIDPGSLSFRDQVRAFQEAEVVISYHGAALFNLLFVPPNCKVLEIFSTDYFRTDCYYNLAGIRKLDYWYIIGEKVNAQWGNITIPPTLISQTLNKMLIND